MGPTDSLDAATSLGALSLTQTCTLILEGLRDPRNDWAWREFTGRFLPPLVSFIRRHGFGPEDAGDIAQNALLAFFEAYRRGDYDRDKGRLRDWLFGIARHRLLEARRKQARRREVQMADDGGRPNFLEDIPVPDSELSRTWDTVFRMAMYRQALDVVRRRVAPKTFEAFQLFTRGGLSADEVANKLEMTREAVYMAKHRVLNMIRAEVREMEETC